MLKNIRNTMIDKYIYINLLLKNIIIIIIINIINMIIISND